MDVSPVQVAEVGYSWKSILKFIIYSIIFVILLLNYATTALQQNKPILILYDMGNVFVLATSNLQTSSQALIDGGMVSKLGTGLFSTIWKTTVLYVEILASLLIIWTWINIFAWLYGHSPFSTPINSFTNYCVAFIIFYLFSVLCLVINASLKGNLTGITQVAPLLLTPILCYWVFGKMLGFVIMSFSGRFKK